MTTEDYKWIHKPDHPNSFLSGKITEHRLVMSEHLGRPLEKDEVVHHLDGNKRNNDISNLELMSSREHHQHHYRENSEKLIEASRSPEAILKKKETFRKNKHAQGKRNSQYGTIWITNGTQNRKLKPDQEMPEGFYKGRS